MQKADRRGSYPVPDRRSGRPKGAPLFFFLVMIILSASVLILIARKPAGRTMVLMTREAETTPSTSPVPYQFPVHVDGEVVRPGLYYFGDQAILGDAIDQAGGFTPSADCSAINLAMLLQPHMKIYVPYEGEEGVQPITADGLAGGLEAKVDLNRASRQELETLPGVGEATALAIIAYREENGPFRAIEDLMQVPGIKEGRFSKLKDRIFVNRP